LEGLSTFYRNGTPGTPARDRAARRAFPVRAGDRLDKLQGIGTRYIEAQLFGVTATDPLTFVSGCVLLAMAGITASVIPAVRAMRVDPVIALRRM
jgi:hypothetical protein